MATLSVSTLIQKAGFSAEPTVATRVAGTYPREATLEKTGASMVHSPIPTLLGYKRAFMDIDMR